jgi:hypothetical protein
MINGELQCIPGIWSASDKPGVPPGCDSLKDWFRNLFLPGQEMHRGLIKSLPWAALPVFLERGGVILKKCRCKTLDHSGFFNSSAELEILSSGKNVKRFYSVNFRAFAIIKSHQNT